MGARAGGHHPHTSARPGPAHAEAQVGAHTPCMRRPPWPGLGCACADPGPRIGLAVIGADVQVASGASKRVLRITPSWSPPVAGALHGSQGHEGLAVRGGALLVRSADALLVRSAGALLDRSQKENRRTLRLSGPRASPAAAPNAPQGAGTGSGSWSGSRTRRAGGRKDGSRQRRSSRGPQQEGLARPCFSGARPGLGAHSASKRPGNVLRELGSPGETEDEALLEGGAPHQT
ncbi:unnamed protein product [Prorocentrum cordatum]|uniref:Uncharacterized protein n=1 Tax=Prorocentrum cordatum TaxID=2364126 RepID=A0ABN9Q5K9_9DINO|nr:unnamed protein product [Polarella glacialis]